MAEITKIVVTGGPCAGKSTGKCVIEEEFTELGYKVLFVPETATELIVGGVSPVTCGTNMDFQKCLMQLQLEKERIFEQAAKTMSAEKVLIVCDRGALDNKAYLTETEFDELLRGCGCNEVELRDSYDAVFHLTTAAKGAEKFYTTDNNTARTETAEQARALDDKLISAWTGHPHFRIVDNSTDFAEKMKRLTAEIRAFLGEPVPCEIERKFLIEYPDIQKLDSMPNCQKIEIIQTYLESEKNEEVRVRQRGLNGHYIYFETKKISLDDKGLERIEIEHRLNQNQYLERLMRADSTRKPIRKNRYCLSENNTYFEIDVYPFWDDKAIVEIELASSDEEIVFPEILHVIREVTDDEAYKNASLARRN